MLGAFPYEIDEEISLKRGRFDCDSRSRFMSLLL